MVQISSGHGAGFATKAFDRGGDAQRGRFAVTGRFGRLFPWLRSLRAFEPGPEALGAVGGPMDGGIPAPTDTSQDNPRIKAGYTFLGQFVDHDLTLDATSILEQQIDPFALVNFRTPALELDSLYGLGPRVQPYLYEKGTGRLLLGEGGADLQRNAQGVAIIGDPRNDENVVVSQLHRLFARFHNAVYDGLGDTGELERFEEAQRIVRWHYQWIVLHEFLPRTVGSRALKWAGANPFAFDEERGAYMPLEFSVAAYRFGHSQVRPGYLLSAPGSQPVRAAALFPGAVDDPDFTRDLRGGRAIPEALRVDWAAFFGPDAQASKLIDTRISTPLLKLPQSVTGDAAPANSLAVRNLQRGIDARLPGGQTVAAHLGLEPLSEAQLWDGVAGGAGEAPLWYYCLREAEVMTGGRRLAGLGARIVARTFLAILMADKASFVSQDPGWRPHLGAGDGFTMSDLVNVALGTSLASEQVSALPGTMPQTAPVPEPVA